MCARVCACVRSCVRTCVFVCVCITEAVPVMCVLHTEAVSVVCVTEAVSVMCVLQRLWPSLNYGFSKVLGERYDSATADAWRRVYNYISMQMKRGMENPDIEPSDDAMGS